MSTHLSSREFVDALENALAPVRRQHMAACEKCRTELDALKSMRADVEGTADVPEPSPLFWDYFQARVRDAVAADASTEPASPAWWRVPSRALVAAGALASLLIAVAVWSNRPVLETVSTPDAVAQADVLGDTLQWQFVASVLETLEAEDVRDVLGPTSGSAETMFEVLDDAERREFVRLLRAEMN